MNEIPISNEFMKYLRNLPFGKPDQLGIRRWEEDIYCVNHGVPTHTDNTREGFDSILCVLVNDGNFKFDIKGKRAILTRLLKEGTIIRFDGNIEHSLYDGGRRGLFIYLIWDNPKSATTKELSKQIKTRLEILELNLTHEH